MGVIKRFTKEHPVLMILAAFALDTWAASIIKAIDDKRKRDNVIDVEYVEKES